jgi:hypothetical protein
VTTIATHAQVAELVRADPDFARRLGELAELIGVDGVEPHDSVALGRDQRRLVLTGRSAASARALLSEEGDLLVRFAAARHRLLSASDNAWRGQWPKGKEPGGGDVPVVVRTRPGSSRQLLFHALCDLLVLHHDDDAVLEEYLTALRLPVRDRRAWHRALTAARREAEDGGGDAQTRGTTSAP